MTVDDTVRALLWSYPNLFSSRAEALHHLFYVLGNGYEWINGELVNEYFDYDKSDNDAYWDRPEDYPSAHETARIWNEQVDYVRTNIDTLMRDMTFSRQPYPRCDLALMNRLPADIQPDWALAAEEIRAVIDVVREV